jgi:hypothetical protein
MIGRSRGLFRPSFASRPALANAEGAGKAGRRLAPAVRCALVAHRKLHSGIQGSQDIPAFPARMVDGLCRALSGAEFPLASVAPRNSPAPPGWADAAFTGLDRSDDGQDHTVLPYAICAVRHTLPGAHGGRLNPLPAPPSTVHADAAASTASHPRIGRLAIRPSDRVRRRNTYDKPEFR